MSNITRRDLLAGAAGLAAARRRSACRAPSRRTIPTYTPEDGAKLRVLRWEPLRAGRRGRLASPTPRRFTEATGVEVRVDKESWEDMRPKAAVAANVGSGPDIMLGWFDDAAPVSRQARST